MELEAYGELKSVFYDQEVTQIDEQGGKNGTTPDFKVGDDLYVEVYCPDESHDERVRIQEELSKQTGIVRIVLSRPVTGSKPLAVKYATNQTIARLLGSKRAKDQTQAGAKNVLWVDVKHKLKLSVKKTLPIESLNHINHINQTYIGSFGIWHSFYGEVGKSVFPTERYDLKFDGDLNSHSYKQHQHTGLFRDRSTLSAAVVSCLDGNVLFLNPWCFKPLSDDDINRFIKLSQFRPEYSFFVKKTLKEDIASKEMMISTLLNKNGIS